MPEAEQTLPAFCLTDNLNNPCYFPGDESALLCFIKEDCPTCKTILPLLNAVHAAGLPIRVIGQTTDGNRKMLEQHDLKTPILDDGQIRVSFAAALRQEIRHNNDFLSHPRENHSRMRKAYIMVGKYK